MLCVCRKMDICSLLISCSFNNTNKRYNMIWCRNNIRRIYRNIMLLYSCGIHTHTATILYCNDRVNGLTDSNRQCESCTNRKKFQFYRITNQFRKALKQFPLFISFFFFLRSHLFHSISRKMSVPSVINFHHQCWFAFYPLAI